MLVAIANSAAPTAIAPIVGKPSRAVKRHPVKDYESVLSTSAQLNPKPKMLCCLRRGQHSILGFGFNSDHLLIAILNGLWEVTTSLQPMSQVI